MKVCEFWLEEFEELWGLRHFDVCYVAFLTFNPEVRPVLCVVWEGDGAQLVECWTRTPLMQVRFLGAAKDFFTQNRLSVQTLLRCPYTPMFNGMH